VPPCSLPRLLRLPLLAVSPPLVGHGRDRPARSQVGIVMENIVQGWNTMLSKNCNIL
jgi:hypothetical protein